MNPDTNFEDISIYDFLPLWMLQEHRKVPHNRYDNMDDLVSIIMHDYLMKTCPDCRTCHNCGFDTTPHVSLESQKKTRHDAAIRVVLTAPVTCCNCDGPLNAEDDPPLPEGEAHEALWKAVAAADQKAEKKAMEAS